jgi:hypothetical protein
MGKASMGEDVVNRLTIGELLLARGCGLIAGMGLLRARTLRARSCSPVNAVLPS